MERKVTGNLPMRRVTHQFARCSTSGPTYRHSKRFVRHVTMHYSRVRIFKHGSN